MERARASFLIGATWILLAALFVIPDSRPARAESAAAGASGLAAIREEIAAISEEIVEATTRQRRLAGGPIKALILERIAILEVSRALLRQRAIAIETGATMPVRLRVAPPDSARAAALAGRIADIRRQQEERRARLVEYPVGVVRARLEAAVATLEVTLATLQHERMKALFGIAWPTPARDVARPSDAGTTGAAVAAVDTATWLLPPTVTKKRFQPVDSKRGIFHQALWFTIVWDTSRLPRPVQAVSGVLTASDRFDRPRLSVRWDIEDELRPGQPYKESGVGFAYDPLLPEHQWVRAMKLKDMRWSFRVDRILYQDGTRREFELES